MLSPTNSNLPSAPIVKTNTLLSILSLILCAACGAGMFFLIKGLKNNDADSEQDDDDHGTGHNRHHSDEMSKFLGELIGVIALALVGLGFFVGSVGLGMSSCRSEEKVGERTPLLPTQLSKTRLESGDNNERVMAGDPELPAGLTP